MSWHLRIYDAIKQQHIYQQMQTLTGKRFYEWRYQNKVFYLKYYPDQQIAESFKYVKNLKVLVWDFSKNCSEILKKQIFDTLEQLLVNTTACARYKNKRLQALKILYDSCIRQNITDIGMLEIEQFESICTDFRKPGNESLGYQLSIIGTCRKIAFMQQEHIQWDATVWYLDRFHLGENRIDKSKSLNSISFMEIKEKQNREILQAYMKYELGVTGQAVSTINRRFMCIRNFLKMLEQKRTLAVHATAEDLSDYAKDLLEHHVQAKGFNERIYSIGHFYKFMEVREYIPKMPFRIEYFQQKVLMVHHDRSVEEIVYMEVLKKLYLFPERLRCMFLHLWCLGLRASEVCTLKGNAYYQQGEASGYYASGRFVELTVPIMAGSETEKKIAGVILVSASTDSIYAKLSEFRRSSEIWVSVIAICSLAFSILLSNWLLRPLKHMNQYIGDLAEGSLDGDLDIHDCTETENISNTFNIMLARLRLVEESRQEFVANVSHELKTPLTSMKVLADSLLMQGDAPVELYKEFMQDIANEIDRESSVISDLLTLVKMDRKSTELNVASTDINDFIEQILKRLRPIAEKANIELVFESNRSVTAEIDATKLSLAFSNLVENAIKYNRENGWVRVSLDADHKFFYVKVSDSGIGIPQESIDYIFERFYRVDKSHSREIGGTGLGLAITRSAVVAHRGAIKVQSTVDEGTTFIVRIPLRYIV